MRGIASAQEKGRCAMVRTKDWLPIGSVVHVEGRSGLLMTIACMVGDEETGMLWDYAALPYPQGLTGPAGNVLFDKESIDGVFGLGFQNEDGEHMQELLLQAQEAFEEEKRKVRIA